MPRQSEAFISQSDFRGGICSELEATQPNQVRDARNVWTPKGALTSRPGVVPVVSMPGTIGSASVGEGVGTTTGVTVVREDNGAATPVYATTDTLSSGGDQFMARTSTRTGDRWYLGTDTVPYGWISIEMGTTNSAASRAKCEYWNGSSWKYLPFVETASTTPFARVNSHLNTGFSLILFVPPGDHAQTSVNSLTKYWLRFEALDVDFDTSVVINSVNCTYASTAATKSSNTLLNMQTQFATYSRFISVYTEHRAVTTDIPSSTLYIENAASSARSDVKRTSVTITDPIIDLSEPCSYAELPLINTVYIQWEGNGYTVVADSAPAAATTETRAEYVGSIGDIKSDYHPDLVPQYTAWPKAKYIAVARNCLFFANFKDANAAITWSAPYPAHTVMPQANFEFLIDSDNSGISGLAVLNENVIVFKRDSIWQMIDAGQNPINGLQRFVARKIVDGIGCVSHSSIVATPRGLIFASENGVYLFDGTPNTKKLTENKINEFYNNLSTSLQYKWVATKWIKYNLYMLAVRNTAGYNDTVLVYDWNRDSWQIWDGIEPQAWLRYEDSADVETIALVTARNSLVELKPGKHEDHGTAISSYVQTHINFGQTNDDEVHSRFNTLWITGQNNTATAAVTIARNDEDSPSSFNVTYTDANEPLLGTTFTIGTSKLSRIKDRVRRADIRIDGQWVDVKVASSTKGFPLNVSKLKLGFDPKGQR